MEEFDTSNILSGEEIDTLFQEDINEEEVKSENSDEKDNEIKQENNQKTTEDSVNEETLFEDPESVGSEEEDKQGKEDTKIEKKTGTSPSNNFYSSIASALVEDGIFPNLDEKDVSGISTAEDFAEAVRKEIEAQFDERTKRVDAALTAGVEPTEIQKYERTIEYLDSIDDTLISEESEKGETIRKQLIYNDFINRGYSKERANREVKKSIDGGTDIEDAKEALQSNKSFFKESYDALVKSAQEESRKYEEQRKKEAETLKNDMLNNKEVFNGLQIDMNTRRKAFDAISKPVYKDPETGELFTAVQKYEMDNHLDFLKNVGLLYTLTDGFKNLDKLINQKVKKELKKGIRNLENTINNTSRTSDGNLRFANNIGDDPDSYMGKGWKLDV